MQDYQTLIHSESPFKEYWQWLHVRGKEIRNTQQFSSKEAANKAMTENTVKWTKWRLIPVTINQPKPDWHD